MPLLEILSAALPVAQPLLEWAIEAGKESGKERKDIAKAFFNYKNELKLNCAILEKIDLKQIDTRNIGDPALKGIASRLKTNAAEALLLALLSHIQNPQKAVKKIAPKMAAGDEAEARQVIKAIISVVEKTRQLQCFTSLSEDERRILKGFYARARIKHITVKSLYIWVKIQDEKKR